MSITDSIEKQLLDAIRDVSRRVRRLETLENPVDVPTAADFFGGAFGKIVRILNQGGGIELYDVDTDGLSAALGNCIDDDAVWMPNGRIVGYFEVPRNVTLQGYAEKSIIDGQFTLNEGSIVKDITIERAVLGGSIEYLYLYDYDHAFGFIGPPQGTATLRNCKATISHYGFGDIYVAYQQYGAGRMEIYDCEFYASHEGIWGNSYALGVANGSDMYVEETDLIGVSGSHRGYAGFVWAGELTVEGGSAFGSTSRFGKA